MEDTERLTKKQQQYVQLLATGMESRQAARSAGYSESFSRVAAHRLGKKPAVAGAIEEIRKKGCEMAAYGLAEAMREAEAVCAFAKKHKNAMAYCKGTELRAKLSGLLIDRIEIVPVDLKGALEAAKSRVLTMIDITPRTPGSGADLIGPSLLDGATVRGSASRNAATQGGPLES